MTLWTEIHTVDGRCISRTHGLTDRFGYAQTIISADAGCRKDQVELAEFDDGDWYTVRKEKYARLVDEITTTMPERETIVPNAAAQMRIAKLEAEVAFLKHEVDVWKDRWQSADEALEQTIQEFSREAAE